MREDDIKESLIDIITEWEEFARWLDLQKLMEKAKNNDLALR